MSHCLTDLELVEPPWGPSQVDHDQLDRMTKTLRSIRVANPGKPRIRAYVPADYIDYFQLLFRAIGWDCEVLPHATD